MAFSALSNSSMHASLLWRGRRLAIMVPCLPGVVQHIFRPFFSNFFLTYKEHYCWFISMHGPIFWRRRNIIFCFLITHYHICCVRLILLLNLHVCIPKYIYDTTWFYHWHKTEVTQHRDDARKERRLPNSILRINLPSKLNYLHRHLDRIWQFRLQVKFNASYIPSVLIVS